MPLITSEEQGFLNALSQLAYCNPFTPDRIALERQALGDAFDEQAATWSKRSEWDQERPNIVQLRHRCGEISQALRHRITSGQKPTSQEILLYEDLISYLLYDRYRVDFVKASERTVGRGNQPFAFFDAFQRDVDHFLRQTGLAPFKDFDTNHLFACCYQVCRAFREIFDHIVGTSKPAAQLRARVWQSIFTHDMRRYRRCLYSQMADFTTLITGPSGTGKELVARAIGRSPYIPIDGERKAFGNDLTEIFYPLNLSALSATLIESELFGHTRGSFTGATDDRVGWLEKCPPLGSVFLDEIGDLDAAIQVKLLRVLQSRSFQRLGETTDRKFPGKIIAATHQNLEARIREGTFRNDFYFRLCSDILTTPTLEEQLSDCPEDLPNLVATCVLRVAGEEGLDLVEEVVVWIEEQLGSDYPWPGNFRELEQCVRNVVIRREYQPRLSERTDRRDLRDAVAQEIVAGTLSADEVLSKYCTLVYAQTGSYEQTARQIKLDRRTVKAKLDQDLLARISKES